MRAVVLTLERVGIFLKNQTNTAGAWTSEVSASRLLFYKGLRKDRAKAHNILCFIVSCLASLAETHSEMLQTVSKQCIVND